MHVRREKTDDKLDKSKGKSGPRLHTVIGMKLTDI